MKKLLFTLSILAAGFVAISQDLAPDQNPNYKISIDKYASNQLALQTTNNTTIQDTYKAYDWNTAKDERKTNRRNFRREFRQNNSRNGNWNNNNNWNSGWNNNSWNNGWNNNNWNNGWNNNNWSNNLNNWWNGIGLVDNIFRLFW